MDDGPRYWAFLSYSHSDRAWAHWLHHALETWTVPARLIGHPTAAGPAPRRFKPIFRDRAELAANADLKARVQIGLERSAWLIVICSPAAARSPWVRDEILTFKALHGEARVLAVIVGGEPFASASPAREQEECFPAALRFRLGVDGGVGAEAAEPIAADLRAKGDGRRLARLKLLAGMLGVGLDELVRRDAQRRQREMMALTATSLVGAVAMGALAASALVARDEARHQRAQAETRRAQAEGLVDFMLGDLRGKLEVTGRLDLLDSVGARAMAYYKAAAPLGLDADALGRRARALHLLGDLRDRRGDLGGALAEFNQAFTITAELLARQPNDAQRVFEHSYSAYWVGWIAYQRGQMDEAIARFGEYKRLADRLVALDPKKDAWRAEAAWANSNLQAVLLEEGRAPSALEAFSRSLRISQDLAAKAPGDRDKQMDVAQSYLWLAQAQTARGDLAAAMADRLAERDIYARLLRRQTGDKGAQAAQEANQVAVAKLLALQGRDGAVTELNAATSEIDRLMASEPDNTVYWEQAALAYTALSQVLLKGGSKDAAASAAARASSLAEALARKDGTEAFWRGVLLGTARASVMEAAAERARTAAARRDALAPAPAEAERLARLADQQPANLARARTAAEVSVLAGDDESLDRRDDPARAAWAASVERLGRVGLATATPVHDRGQLIAAKARERLARGEAWPGKASAGSDYGW
jgi:tetratricopeptide (TPR) repeat protein